jgi:hypothetical protein
MSNTAPIQQLHIGSTGPFLFTRLLMPALLAGAQSSSDKRARILFTASIAQSNSIDWHSLTDTPERKKTSPNQRYEQSKFVGATSPYLWHLHAQLFEANVVLAHEFADRCGDQGIISLSLDPGKPVPFWICITLWREPSKAVWKAVCNDICHHWLGLFSCVLSCFMHILAKFYNRAFYCILPRRALLRHYGERPRQKRLILMVKWVLAWLPSFVTLLYTNGQL